MSCRGSRVWIYVASAALAVLWGGLGSSQAQQAPPEVLAGLDAYIEKGLQDWNLPGLAIVVVKDDAVVYSQGFGVRERGAEALVTSETVFAVASHSKAFTTTSLGLLVDEKKLGWNDRISDRLPEFQLSDAAATRSLTVRDLLCHRVGLGTWQGDLLWYGSDRTTEEILRQVRAIPPTFEFRDRYAYCNLTYLAAGELLKRISGKPWGEFVTERLLQPLEMSRTSTSVLALQGMEDVARPHTQVDGEIVAIPYRNLDSAAATGGLNSCVRDWANWIRVQLNDGEYQGRRVIPKEVIEETRSPQNLIRPTSPRQRTVFPTSHLYAYGMGWVLQDYHGRLLVSHSGGMDGMLSLTLLVPEEKLGVAVLTNYDEQDLYQAIPFRVVDAFLKAPERDWSAEFLAFRAERRAREPGEGSTAQSNAPTAPRPPLELSRYVGTYSNPVVGDTTIELVDGSLQISLERQPGLRATLVHKDADRFEAPWVDPFFRTSSVPFRLDDAGRPVEFRFSVRPDFVDPMEYIFTRR